MSLYADYIAETTHGFVVETEDYFATYVFPDDKTCYIKDIYVRPELRRKKIASDISALIESLAKQRGCSRILGSVMPSTKGSTASLKALLADGFRLESASNDFILFSKDI